MFYQVRLCLPKGISEEALVLYHEFIATYGIGEPARTKPAIRYEQLASTSKVEFNTFEFSAEDVEKALGIG